MKIEWDATEIKELHLRRMKQGRYAYILLLLPVYKLIVRLGVLTGILSYLFIIILLEVIGWFLGRKFPRKIHYEITENGIKSSGRPVKDFSEWDNFSNFAVYDQKLKDKSFSKVIAIKGKKFGGDFGLLFDNSDDFEKVKHFLGNKLQEIS